MQPISSGFGCEQRRGQHGRYRSSLSSVLAKSLHLSGSHTHTHTHRGIKAHTDTYCRNAYTHTHADAPRDLTWTSGHLVKEFNWPPSLSLSLSRSLCLSGCHRTCQALMPSNLLPNTHCHLSFKGPLTGMTNISTPPALLLPSLSLSPSVSPFLTAR